MKQEPPILSIILIGYNSKKFLKHCLGGVEKQTLKNVETIFIDNDSSDDSVAYVKRNFKWAKIVDNRENIGYVGAANQGIKMSKAKYVMILNPDLILSPEYLKKIVAKLEKDKKIAAITGKALKYDFEKDEPTKFIDTTGLYCFRNRRVIDRGQGSLDEGQYDKEEEVFGISGAVPVYRREALEDIKLPMLTKDRFHHDDYSDIEFIENAYEYLDEDFFMYKEDIDVSWRLRLRGWKCYYLPQALCHHGRGTGVLKRYTHWEVYQGRKGLSNFQKYYAYKNQRLMQIKNEMWGNFFQDFFPIVSKEILIFGYILFREPYLFKAIWKIFLQLPHALKKRRLIMQRRKVTPDQMAKWLNGSAKF
ncbi:MAG: glycosyltransferase family 2 protein [Candidatus Peregrinibacteria bacterium]|nr:glycosyltransferase family 2 protein [Candidatus Peregrinibacteria bacterium]